MGMEKPEDIAKLLPLSEIYKDLAQPAVRQVGGALESFTKVGRLVLAPIEYLAATQSDRWQRYLRRIAEQVPEERRIEAHTQVSVPVLEGLRYVNEHNIIADLFVNLLARAIDRDRVSEAHPAFPSIISQLSSDEAQIIFWLRKKRYLYRQYAALNSKQVTFSAKQVIENEFPIDKLIFPENFEVYMGHLHSLNLAGIWQHGNQEPILEGEPSIQTGVNIISYADLTPFGRMFAQACVPEELPHSV
jgi:Abortive infection alpha